jgi:hypothetical protein
VTSPTGGADGPGGPVPPAEPVVPGRQVPPDHHLRAAGSAPSALSDARLLLGLVVAPLFALVGLAVLVLAVVNGGILGALLGAAEIGIGAWLTVWIVGERRRRRAAAG